MKARLGALSLVGLLLLAVTEAPEAAARPSGCRVRNLAQATVGRSLGNMVRGAAKGDHLTVTGRCPGRVVIDKDLVITGVGERRPILTGRGRVRVVRVTPGATVSLSRLVITGGGEELEGLSNRGTLSLTDVIVRNNRGTGIENRDGATLLATRIRVIDNRASRGGGAGIANFGTARLEASLVRGNVGDSGGGIHNEMGVLTLVRSRISGNTATFAGGGIFNMYFGRVTLVETVVTGNRADGDGGRRHPGGGINNWTGDDGGGTVTMSPDSSVTGNSPDDCVGTPAC